ncbi:MAG: metallophosphoesterase [Acidimicrobiia bacterium]|nr:metallophosphoesterase [Acidimicrobiia bacterium]MBT8215573.1 metallophosphoesterase [Acidimicrobiia bacterium]NNF11260.1 metallophosphoesterase [Acidimicrobiia bacterium]NNL68995.1 metallophosphoesterase [Acidimicrobiia bacterium]
MILVADVHGASSKLRTLVESIDEPLLVLGDLINFTDYRNFDGILAELSGRDFVADLVGLRMEGRFDDARALWQQRAEGREDELRRRHTELVEEAYIDIMGALSGADAYVTYGNVDRVDVLTRHLPAGSRFIEHDRLEIEGYVVGIVGGGVRSGLNVPGELEDQEMGRRLDALGPVDVLCTHVAPAIPALQRDVVGGMSKGSPAVLEYLTAHQPRFHFFGDVHQPQATHWRVGKTRCRNVGYFRATGRGVQLPSA